MLRNGFVRIKWVLRLLSGGLGGLVVGGLLALLLFHLRLAYSMEFGGLGLKVLLVLVVSSIAGVIAPSFFQMFFLSPLSWLMNGEGPVEGHPSGDNDLSWRGFLLNIAYMLGLVVFVVGTVLSLSWLVGLGLTGILAFSVGMYRISGSSRTKSRS